MKVIKNIIICIVVSIITIMCGIIGFISYKNKNKSFAIVDKNFKGNLNILIDNNINDYVRVCAMEFKKLYPNINVNIKDYKNIYEDLNSEIDRKGTNICLIDNRYIQYVLYKFNDKLEDITDLMDEHRHSFIKNSIKNVSFNERIYGVPFNEQPYVMIYRKDIFDAAHIDVNDIKTWKDYVDFCKLLNKNLKCHYKFMFNYNNIEFFDMFLNQLGRSYKNNEGDLTIKSGESIRALELIKLLYKYNIIYNENIYDNLKDSLIKGKLVSTICTYSDLLNIMKNEPNFKGKFIVKKIPAFEIGGNRDLNKGGYSILVLNNKSTKIGNTFIKFILDNESLHENLYLDQGMITSNTDIYKSKKLVKNNEYFNNEDVFLLMTDIINNAPGINFDKDFKNINWVLDSNLKDIQNYKNNLVNFAVNIIKNIKSKQFP